MGDKVAEICPTCGRGTLRPQQANEGMFGVNLGTFDADACDDCGEVFFTAPSVKRIEARAKELGLWGLASKVKIAKSGDSLVVRIPPPLARYLRIRSGQEVFVAPDRKHMLVLDLA